MCRPRWKQVNNRNPTCPSCSHQLNKNCYLLRVGFFTAWRHSLDWFLCALQNFLWGQSCTRSNITSNPKVHQRMRKYIKGITEGVAGAGRGEGAKGWYTLPVGHLRSSCAKWKKPVWKEAGDGAGLVQCAIFSTTWICACVPIIPALRRWRRKDQKF